MPWRLSYTWFGCFYTTTVCFTFLDISVSMRQGTGKDARVYLNAEDFGFFSHQTSPIVLYKLYINEINFLLFFCSITDCRCWILVILAAPISGIQSKQGRTTAAIFAPADELRYCCSLPKFTAECIKLQSKIQKCSGIINPDPRSFGDEKQHTNSANWS